MLKHFFQPKWQHKNPDIRQQAVEKLTANDNDILLQLALNDEVATIRQLAISKLESAELLLNLHQQTQHANDKNLALKHWVYLLDDNKLMPAADAEQWIAGCEDQTLLTGIIAYTNNPAFNALALAGINKPEEILALIAQTTQAKCWQQLIEKLNDETSLKKAQDIVKGRDKKSQQLIKAKLNTLKANQLQQQQYQQQAEHILEKLQHLASSEHTPLFHGQLLNLDTQWQQLSTTYQGELTASISDLIQQLYQLEDEQAREAHNAEQVQQAISTQSEQLQSHLQALDEILSNAANLTAESLQSALATLTQENPVNVDKLSKQQQKILGKQQKLTKSIIDALEQLQASDINLLTAENISKLSPAETQQALKALASIKQLSWPEAYPQPEKLTVLQQQYQQLQQQLDRCQTASKDTEKKLRDALQAADMALDSKDLSTARKHWQQATHAIKQLSSGTAHRYQANLQRIAHAVQALEDWKDFATDPKREELCQSMQNLITLDISAMQKSESIRQLQQQWRQLGHCHDQALWQRFQTLSDQAFEPCREFFAEEKNKRQYNAEQKQIICEQMEAFIAKQDWQNCDWKAIEKLHNNIQKEWQRFSPVEREQHKLLQDRYYQSLNIIQEHLQQQRKQNAEQLKQIIIQAQALLETEDLQQAINEFQQLQQQWRQTGITSHNDNNRLWQQFKQIGDALFNKRQQQREAFQSDLSLNLSQAEQVIADITQWIANIDTTASSQHLQQQLQSFRQKFNDIGQLPKKHYAKTKQDFDKLYQDGEKCIKQLSNQQWLQRFEQAQKLGQALAFGGPIDDHNELIESLPKAWQEQLSQRIQFDDKQAASEHARKLCIDLELLLECESPDEDKPLRMEYQMKKLQQGIGSLNDSSNLSLKQRAEALFLQWFQQQCWNEEEYQKLNQRFIETFKQGFN